MNSHDIYSNLILTIQIQFYGFKSFFQFKYNLFTHNYMVSRNSYLIQIIWTELYDFKYSYLKFIFFRTDLFDPHMELDPNKYHHLGSD